MTVMLLAFFSQHNVMDKKQLVGHIPVEIYQLVNYFIEVANANTIIAVVTGKTEWEIGLIVPSNFVYRENKNRAQILLAKLL